MPNGLWCGRLRPPAGVSEKHCLKSNQVATDLRLKFANVVAIGRVTLLDAGIQNFPSRNDGRCLFEKNGVRLAIDCRQQQIVRVRVKQIRLLNEILAFLIESPIATKPSIEVFGEVFRVVLERCHAVTKHVTIEAAGNPQRFTQGDEPLLNLRQRLLNLRMIERLELMRE